MEKIDELEKRVVLYTLNIERYGEPFQLKIPDFELVKYYLVDLGSCKLNSRASNQSSRWWRRACSSQISSPILH